MRKIISALALLVASAAAQAGLVLHVSPDGFGGTRWQFEGSTTALAASAVNSFWGEDSGTLVASFVGNRGITSGAGSMSSTSGGTQAIVDVWASQHTYDGLAPRSNGLSWLAGDILSWSGDLMSDLPFAQLIVGTVVADNILFGVPISDTLTITVSRSPLGNPVPVPSSLTLLGLALASFAFARRKSRT